MAMWRSFVRRRGGNRLPPVAAEMANGGQSRGKATQKTRRISLKVSVRYVSPSAGRKSAMQLMAKLFLALPHSGPVEMRPAVRPAGAYPDVRDW